MINNFNKKASTNADTRLCTQLKSCTLTNFWLLAIPTQHVGTLHQALFIAGPLLSDFYNLNYE